jgi:hypothetical protein
MNFLEYFYKVFIEIATSILSLLIYYILCTNAINIYV